MSDERELERHNKVIEQINNATKKEELPNVTISNISSYLATNIYFNDKKLSSSVFSIIASEIYNNGGLALNLKDEIVAIIKENYADVSDELIEGKLTKVLDGVRIKYLVEEISLRNNKINEFEEKELLEAHNQNMSDIRNTIEIKYLPSITRAKLATLLADNSKNSITERISSTNLYKLVDVLLSGKTLNDREVKYQLLMACKKASPGNQNKMYEEILPQLMEKELRIKYLVEEINLREKKIPELYKDEYEDIMNRIKEANRISQLPGNLTISTLTGYFSGNSTIYPKSDKITSSEFVSLANMFLAGKTFEDEEVKNEIESISNKVYPGDNVAKKILFDKLFLLPKTYYLVKEINYSKERQIEFIGRGSSNVNVYFVPNPNSPVDGGLFYNCYINRIDNLDLNSIIPLNLDEIVPDKLDVDSIEWYIQEKYDPTFKAAGGIILNKDETIGNVNVFQPSEGKIGITKEEQTRYEELEDLSKKVKSVISKKKIETQKFIEMQNAFLETQRLMDEELTSLEEKIDSLVSEDKEKEGNINAK